MLSVSVIRRGDADAAIATAAHVVSDRFTTAAIEHAYLEPESCLAVPQVADGVGGGGRTTGRPRSGHRLHVLSQGQGAWEDRRQIASFLGLAPTDVLVTQVATGGAFGGKEDLNVQPHAALLALAHRAARDARAVARREPALLGEAPSLLDGLHRGL